MDADPNKQALDAKQTIIFNLIFFCGLCSIQSARLLRLSFNWNCGDKLLGLYTQDVTVEKLRRDRQSFALTLAVFSQILSKLMKLLNVAI